MSDMENKRRAFTSISEISQERERVLAEIRKDGDQMGVMWKDLFRNEAPRKKGFNLASMLNMGTGLLDGFLLAWKLYRKFRR